MGGGSEGPTLQPTPPPFPVSVSGVSVQGQAVSRSLDEVASQPWQIAVVSGVLFVSLPGLDLIFARCPDLLLWFVPGKIFVWWKCALFYQTENVLGYKILKWKSSIQPLSVIPFSLLSGLQASNVVLFGWFFLRPPHCVTGLKLMVLLPLAQTSLRITGVCHWVLLLRPGGSFALRSL